MAFYTITEDSPTVLQHVVSELRWVLANDPDLRGSVTRIVRRYEDQLHGVRAGGNVSGPRRVR